MCDCEVIGIMNLISKKVKNGRKLSEKLFREVIEEYNQAGWNMGTLYRVGDDGKAIKISDPEECRKFRETIESQYREPPVIEYMKKKMDW